MGTAVNTLFCCVALPRSAFAGFLSFFLSTAAFMVDVSSVVFICVVVLVGIMTQIYATAYMRTERSGFVFIALLGVFIVSMCLLVLANSFSVFFVAWELIGFCSFILIGFWSGRSFSIGAAIKAVSVNRFPDMALLLAFCICSVMVGVSDFSTLADCGGSPGVLCQLCFVFAAAGKSAQVGFTGWLLSAMEGPTPVSALMHAATLVTAGIV